MQDCIILDVALRVHLQRDRFGASTVLAPHVEGILRDMDFGEGAAVAEVRHLARHPALSLALRWRLVLGCALGLRLWALLFVVVVVRPSARREPRGSTTPADATRGSRWPTPGGTPPPPRNEAHAQAAGRGEMPAATRRLREPQRAAATCHARPRGAQRGAGGRRVAERSRGRRAARPRPRGRARTCCWGPWAWAGWTQCPRRPCAPPSRSSRPLSAAQALELCRRTAIPYTQGIAVYKMRGLECRQVCTCCHALIENEAFHFCASAEKSRFRLLDTRPLLQNKLSCAQKEARHKRKEAHDSVVSASAWRFGAVERCARDRACASPTRRHPCCRWCARGSAWSPRCAGRTRGALCPRAVASHGTWIRTSRRQAARDRVSGVAPAHGQARRACLLAGHQTARAGARKGRGRDPRPRRRLGSVGLKRH